MGKGAVAEKENGDVLEGRRGKWATVGRIFLGKKKSKEQNRGTKRRKSWREVVLKLFQE